MTQWYSGYGPHNWSWCRMVEAPRATRRFFFSVHLQFCCPTSRGCVYVEMYAVLDRLGLWNSLEEQAGTMALRILSDRSTRQLRLGEPGLHEFLAHLGWVLALFVAESCGPKGCNSIGI
jgi:hypothetical protein